MQSNTYASTHESVQNDFDVLPFIQDKIEAIKTRSLQKIETEINQEVGILQQFFNSRLSAKRFEDAYNIPHPTLYNLLAKYDLPVKALDDNQYESLKLRTRRQRKELFACKSNCRSSQLVLSLIEGED